MRIEAVFFPIIPALIGTFLFAYIARKLKIRLQYKTNRREVYVGPLPFLGSLLGVILGYWLNNHPLKGINLDYKLLLIILTFAGIGFLRDKHRFSKLSTFLIAIPATVLAMNFYFSGIILPKLISFSCFATIILLCLKLASLVYEMPFILLSASSLAHLLYMINCCSQYNMTIIVIDTALMTFAAAAIINTFSRRRILMSNSGIFATGIALAMVSLIEPSGKLIFFTFFIPAMTLLYPIAFVCLMLVASYFGNKLHKKEDENKHSWRWSLNREKVINFTALIFYCLNFTGLLVLFKAPWYGYFSLLILFVLTLSSFIKAFARKSVTSESQPDKIELLGITIDAISPKKVIERINKHIPNRMSGFMHIITADSLAIARAKQDPDFKKILDRAEMVVPDGAGIVWAADFMGTPLPGRVPGVALVSQICEISAKAGYKIFFIGSKPGVAEKAAETIAEGTKVSFVGIENGYFKPDSEEEVKILEKIAESGADIVFVALGVPRQEDFITKLRKYAPHTVAIGVGGSFDVISGSLPRAPIWMQQCGVEWLFRLWLEPKRIARMLEIPVFVLRVMRHKFNRD